LDFCHVLYDTLLADAVTFWTDEHQSLSTDYSQLLLFILFESDIPSLFYFTVWTVVKSRSL